MQLGLKAERRARTGSKAYSLSFGFSNTNEVVEPIEQDAVDVSGTANYTRGKLGVKVLAGYSRFDNHVDAMTVDNRQVRHSVRSGLSVALYSTTSAAIPASIAQNSVVMKDSFVSRNAR